MLKRREKNSDSFMSVYGKYYVRVQSTMEQSPHNIFKHKEI